MSWDFLFGSLSNFYELTYLKMALLMTLCVSQSLHIEEPVIFKVSVCNQDLKIVSCVRSGIRKPDLGLLEPPRLTQTIVPCSLFLAEKI